MMVIEMGLLGWGLVANALLLKGIIANSTMAATQAEMVAANGTDLFLLAEFPLTTHIDTY